MNNQLKKIIIFGATGTIGKLTIECLNENFELIGFSYFKNEKKALEIAKRFPNATMINLLDIDYNKISNYIKSLKPDLVVNAVSGWNGLLISRICLELNIDLSLANKETFVIGNELFLNLLKKSTSKIYPIDSEHSSLYELLKNDKDQIEEIYITASGGPFLNKKISELENIKFSEAINHPNWKMGEQISLDSSTMVNKFYELVEAAYLTNFKIKITPIIHSESIVHSMVRYHNNSFLMNVSYPDMKLPIDLALNDFKKQSPKIKKLDFSNLQLNFKIIDKERFVPIKWFNEFFETKNYLIPVIVNITNEWCFVKFKNDSIKYLDIIKIIEKSINVFKSYKINSWEELVEFKERIINWLEFKHYE